MLQYDYYYSLYIYSSSTRAYTLERTWRLLSQSQQWVARHRTIVIVLSRYDDPPFLLSEDIVSCDKSLKDKETSLVLSEEIVLPDSLVQENKPHLHKKATVIAC